MPAKLLEGKVIAQKYITRFKIEIDTIGQKYNKIPKLSIILVGNDPASLLYDKNKMKRATELGIKAELHHLPDNISEDELLTLIQKLNKDKGVNGILVQLPLPNHIPELNIINAILPDKDVDGFTFINKGKLAAGDLGGLIPCTPLGILKLLEAYKIKVEGKRVTILGRSNIVGRPMSALLLNNNATVSICHSRTKNLKTFTKDADIIISAMGIKANMITSSYIKKSAIVVDVAMIRDFKENKLYGDIDFKTVSKIAKYITPIPGGVGPMTIAMLMNNTIEAFCIQNKIERKSLCKS